MKEQFLTADNVENEKKQKPALIEEHEEDELNKYRSSILENKAKALNEVDSAMEELKKKLSILNDDNKNILNQYEEYINNLRKKPEIFINDNNKNGVCVMVCKYVMPSKNENDELINMLETIRLKYSN